MKYDTNNAAVAAVAFPAAISGVYDYSIPERFAAAAAPGLPVLVEVRGRKIWGVILNVKSKSEYHTLKEVIDIKEGRWADSNRSLLKLYEWIASYYQCPMGRVFRPIISKSVITKKAKTVVVYRCVDGIDDMDSIVISLKDDHRKIFETIRNHPDPLTSSELLDKFGIKPSALTSLRKKGLLVKDTKIVNREAYEMSIENTIDTNSVTLSHEQQLCVDTVAASMDSSQDQPQKPFLLYGITGSGKTHVYTELARKALAAGRGVMILVPEISLTPQTITRFRAALGGAVTVIHSRMSDGERRDAMQDVVTGRRRAVIGVRSAVLAPMDGLGLIVVDEEHDASYKQSDTDPRYNARDVAVMRGKLQGAAVVLGSATPSLESYSNALSGKYRLLTLTKRHGDAALPAVAIVDMAAEHRENNWTPLSRALAARMEETLARRGHIILLLNRRGFSAVLLCKSCGYSHTCPNCSVNMRYHKADTVLKCHLCGREEAVIAACPKCGGLKIKYMGTGIQKAEELLRERFPEARILRMDQDTTRRKGAHADILEEFAAGGADILLGTQMVAKGLNFPNVTLVGILQADTGLHFPDFRACERTFQLLTQAAGRAGRAERIGEVVIQTYSPREPSIKFAAEHDYLSFYDHEIKNRRELMYPPFGKVARVVAEGPREEVIREFSHKSARMILSRNDKKIRILGPAPAVLSKIDNVHRFSMILKSSSHKILGDALVEIRKLAQSDLPPQYRCVVDVDPFNML